MEGDEEVHDLQYEALSTEVSCEQPLGPRRHYPDRPPDPYWQEPHVAPLHFELVLDDEELIHFSPLQTAAGHACTLVLTDAALYTLLGGAVAHVPDASENDDAASERRWYDGLVEAGILPGIPARPPRERRGVQRWRHGKSTVTRIDIQLLMYDPRDLEDALIYLEQNQAGDISPKQHQQCQQHPSSFPPPSATLPLATPPLATPMLTPAPLAPPTLAPPQLTPPQLAPPQLALPQLAPPQLVPLLPGPTPPGSPPRVPLSPTSPPTPQVELAPPPPPPPPLAPPSLMSPPPLEPPPLVPPPPPPPSPPESPSSAHLAYDALATAAESSRSGGVLVAATSIAADAQLCLLTLCILVLNDRLPAAAVELLESPTQELPHTHLLYQCKSPQDCSLWRVALNRAISLHWQALIEGTQLPAPEVYVYHAHAKELRKNVVAFRTVVVADRRLYAHDREGATLRKVKWFIDIKAVQTLSQHRVNDKRLLAEPWGLTLNWAVKKRGQLALDSEFETVTLAFRMQQEVHQLTAYLDAQYHEVTGKTIPEVASVQ